MAELLKKISNTFVEQGISLAEDLNYSKQCHLQESKTNQFIKVTDNNKQEYLIRINGKLWAPFTRKGEDYNLSELKQNKLNTQVIVNAEEFQICRLEPEKNQLAAIKKQGLSLLPTLELVARKIRNYHDTAKFKNYYKTGEIIQNSFTRISEDQQKKLAAFYKLILSMLYTLHNDTEKQVASHNDLLLSSIYLKKDDEVAIVDWEYSGINHRSYDLAFLLVKLLPTLQEEELFLDAYDPDHKFNLNFSVKLMKPIINFTFLLWNTSSNNEIKDNIFQAMITNIQTALAHRSPQGLIAENSLCFYSEKKNREKPDPARAPDSAFSKIEFKPSYR